MRKFDGNCTEGRKDEEGTRDQETERRIEREQEIMCKRLSSHTHDPGDRIQIYWFLVYMCEMGRGGEGKR